MKKVAQKTKIVAVRLTRFILESIIYTVLLFASHACIEDKIF